MRSVIADFQAAVDANDASLLAPLLDPDVVLHGSVTGRPFQGRDTAVSVFQMMMELFSDVRYVGEYQGPEGVTLLIHGTVGG